MLRELNLNSLDYYKTKLQKKSYKRILKFENYYSIAYIQENWIFAVRNVIKIKNKDFKEFKKLLKEYLLWK